MGQFTDLFKGLMFLQGHFTRPEDLDGGFASLGNRTASDRWFRRNSGAGYDAATASAGFSLVEHLQFLGGRPMHAGHNLDAEEPFEQLAAANDSPALRECAACG